MFNTFGGIASETSKGIPPVCGYYTQKHSVILARANKANEKCKYLSCAERERKREKNVTVLFRAVTMVD